MEVREINAIELSYLAEMCYLSLRENSGLQRANHDYRSIQDWQDILSSSLKRLVTYTYVLSDKSQTFGLVICTEKFLDFKPTLLIEHICVPIEYRSTGVAAILLERVIDLARSIGCARIEGRIGSDNYIALKFAKKKSFVSNDKNGRYCLQISD